MIGAASDGSDGDGREAGSPLKVTMKLRLLLVPLAAAAAAPEWLERGRAGLDELFAEGRPMKFRDAGTPVGFAKALGALPARDDWRRPFVDVRGDGNAKLANQPTRAEFTKAARDADSGLSAVVRLEGLDAEKADVALRRLGAPDGLHDLDAGDTAHVYVSAPNAAALNNHTDDTDVIVVQVSGKKAWFLCAKSDVHAAPDRCAAYDAAETAFFTDDFETCWTETLERGAGAGTQSAFKVPFLRAGRACS